jgi:putative ATP-dependent endonuclease of OLD family
MKLVAFAVQNYRSIKATPPLKLSNFTVLVGPNNEGKSNLLSALVCALALTQEVRGVPRRMLLTGRSSYVFRRDFPVALQGSSSAGPSKFTLEFELDDSDTAAFRAAVGSKLSGTLKIQLKVTKDEEAEFSVLIQGPAQKKLSAKRGQIGKFISERLQFQYIGAVRSEEQSREIVDAMVSRALLQLETNPDYQAALQRVEDIERPLLDAVSANIESSLRPFLPDLKKVNSLVSKEQRARALRRSVEIWLDDGTATPLSQKGDWPCP